MMMSSSYSSSRCCYSSAMRVRASAYDTQQRLSYNPNAPRNPNKTPPPKPTTFTPPPTPSSSSSAIATASQPAITLTTQSVSELLKLKDNNNNNNNNNKTSYPGEFDETYLGYDRWLPNPPKVEKPRSVYNAATLAYIGDSIYELYARRHFLFPPLSIEEYNDRVMALVRCEAQDALLQKLISDNCLSEEERAVLRWGKNIGSARTRSKRRAGVAIYNRASSLETLVGYLYLTNVNRLEEVMEKLGFSAGSSTQMIVK